MSNTPATKDETLKIVGCTPGNPQPHVVVEQLTSEAGKEINMLTIRCMDKKWTRIVDVSYDKNETLI
jgi:hypothetical protein